MKRVAFTLLLVVGLVLLSVSGADARFLGTDMVSNLAPSAGVGGLMDKYPLSAYTLDYHVDVGVTELNGVPPLIAQWAAAQMWSAVAFLFKIAIDLFIWSFSLDLINGSGGALLPIGEAVRSLYYNTLGEQWFLVGISCLGLWALWKSLVQRRHSEAGASLGVSIACAVVAMAIIFSPMETIGWATKLSNQMSLAFLSASTGGGSNPTDAKRRVVDHMFNTFIYTPWVALNFGGLDHCVDTRHIDDQGYPKPVAPNNPAKTVCRDHIRKNAAGYGGYADRFLKQPAGSDQRDAEYKAIRDGELPFPSVSQFDGWKVDKNDSPAVDMQQSGGAFQRFTVTLVVLLGSIGAIALLIMLSAMIVVSAAVALVLFGFSVVFLVLGLIPGFGHAAFRAWIGRLGVAIFVKAVYSLVLGIVLAVSLALSDATTDIGFLFAFGLQAIFFWSLFLYRKAISARLTKAVAGERARNAPPVIRRGAEAAAHPITSAATAVGVWRNKDSREDHSYSEHGGSHSEHTTSEHDLGSTADRTVIVDLPRHPSGGHGPPPVGRDEGPHDSPHEPEPEPERNHNHGRPPEKDDEMIRAEKKPHVVPHVKRDNGVNPVMVMDPDRDTSAMPKVPVRVRDDESPPEYEPDGRLERDKL